MYLRAPHPRQPYNIIYNIHNMLYIIYYNVNDNHSNNDKHMNNNNNNNTNLI